MSDVQSDNVLDSTAAGGMIIRGGAVRAAGYVAGTLASLVGIAVVARHLGPADFGRFQTVLALLAAVGAITDAGLATLGLREYAQRDGEERESMLRALLGLRIGLSLVGTLVATGFAVAAGYDATLLTGTVLQGLGLVLTVWQTTLTVPLQTELRLVAVSAMDLLRQVATTASYAGVVLAGAGLGSLLAVPIPVGIVVLGATMLLARHHGLVPTIDLARWKALLKVSAAFVLASSVGTLYIYAAMLLMSLVAGEEQVGLFAASFRVVIVVAGIPGLLVTAAFPLLARAAHNDSERFGYAVSRVEETTMLLGVAAAVVAFAGSTAIIEVAAGPDFAGAAEVLRVHAVVILMTFTATTAGFALLSLHLHRALLICNLVSFTTSCVLVLVLGDAHGAVGGATASAIAETLLAGGYFLALVRADVGVKPSVRTIGGALASGGVAIGLAELSGLPSVPAAVLAIAVYGALVLALRIVPRELTDLVRR